MVSDQAADSAFSSLHGCRTQQQKSAIGAAMCAFHVLLIEKPGTPLLPFLVLV